METERRPGYEPSNRETEKLGCDIESCILCTGQLRFIEIRGRIRSADTITVTKNEILYSLNKPDDFILALVEFHPGNTHTVHREPDFGVTSVNYDFDALLTRTSEPK